MRRDHLIQSFDDLHALYELWENQRLEKLKARLGLIGSQQPPDMEKDPFVDWLVKRGICPHAVVSSNSRYHFENSVLLDTEMGLNLPDSSVSLSDTPALFFQAVNIVRHQRSKVREEESPDAKNSPDQDRH